MAVFGIMRNIFANETYESFWALSNVEKHSVDFVTEK
jgi:hypothetical protein